MHRTIRRTTATLLGLLVAVASSGCGGGDQGVVAGGTAAPPPSATTTAAPPASTTTVARTTSRPTTTLTARPSTTKAAPPKVVVPKQGDRVVAVFVATGATLDDPSFAKARTRLKTLGYGTYSGGDTGCSRGAKEALPQLQDYSLSLEFATRADADRFAALYGTVIGIAGVNVYCAD